MSLAKRNFAPARLSVIKRLDPHDRKKGRLPADPKRPLFDHCFSEYYLSGAIGNRLSSRGNIVSRLLIRNVVECHCNKTCHVITFCLSFIARPCYGDWV